MSKIWRPDLTQFDGPKYLALCHALRDAVRSGALPEGARLPPVRELAWSLSITPGTVARAYQIVTQEGLLQATVGRGTFVAAREPRLGPTQPIFEEIEAERLGLSASNLIDLRSPQLPEVGQTAAISAILLQIAGQMGQDHLEYPSLRRDVPLRMAYADWLGDQALGPFSEEEIALTLGGQNALGITLQCCLRGERPHIYCEELAYAGFRRAARLNRAEVVPVQLDEEGMVPEALDAACRRYGGRIVCITPEAQNPTTARMSLARRAEIVRVARRHDLQIIEDNCYSVASASGPALRALAPERTWHITSLSKSISAGLRFGAVICPTGLGEAARLAAQHSYFGLPRPVSDIAYALFRSGEAQRLRDRVQASFARRQEIALNLLGRHEMRWQPGLSFLWLPMPQGWRASTFAREAEANGILIRSADEYALVDGRAPNAVRIALAGAIAEADFTTAIARLAQLLDSPPDDLPV
ncbi:PLP-dependent aminotransferase family protein [Frigidibacter sp. RF13]|uniref:aminotransferase-like domain-containing protein n=1 Tax=Frigidibacter sp. RF13 TaxID=2997340 RepID=UPI00226DCE96|nr:PLP-dependent aminotransferase family protein [Frigidibacter sp. RF13]MCY1127936.1 PLP-dependent aminotransferase family protein [Frigidibacter sp. RF13]